MLKKNCIINSIIRANDNRKFILVCNNWHGWYLANADYNGALYVRQPLRAGGVYNVPNTKC